MTRLSLSATLLAALSAATTAFAESEICPTMYADFQRRQLENFNFTEPFPNEIDGSAKHIPVLTLSEDGTSGTVVVGNGDEVNGVWHPMVASEDPSEVHFITHILVQDQVGAPLVSQVFCSIFFCSLLTAFFLLIYPQIRMTMSSLLDRWTRLSQLLLR